MEEDVDTRDPHPEWNWYRCSFCERDYPLSFDVFTFHPLVPFCEDPDKVWSLALSHTFNPLLHLYNLEETHMYDRWCCVHCASNEGILDTDGYKSYLRMLENSEDFVTQLFAPLTRDQVFAKRVYEMGRRGVRKQINAQAEP